MPTFTVTRSFARVIQHLQQEDGRLSKSQWGRHSVPTWQLCESRNWDNRSEFHVNPQIVEALRDLKFLEQAANFFGRPIRLVYKLSDAGKAYRLPPEKFWVDDPETAD